MRIADINVPRGCEKIFVDIEDDKVIVSYGSKTNDKEFYCAESEENETLPRIGDFSIFWNDKERNDAICANFRGKSYTKDRVGYRTSSGMLYDNAIKFRNLDQYLKIRGIYDDTF